MGLGAVRASVFIKATTLRESSASSLRRILSAALVPK